MHPWCLEFPSYNFRKALCELNAENSEAAVYVQGKDGVIAKRLAETMPPECKKAYDK